MEGKKEAFRMYLEESGTSNALTKCIVKLYEKRSERPANKDDALKFIKDNLADNFPTQADLNKLRREVEDTRVKVAAIKKKEDEAREKAKEEAKKRAEERAKRKAEKLHRQLGGDSFMIPIVDIKTPEEAKARLLELQSNNACTSLLIKNLTVDMVDNLTVETKSQKKLFDCIKPGLDNPNLPVGIYAADADAYDKFEQIFDLIINDYHSVNPSQISPLHDQWDGDADQFVHLDKTHIFLKSTKITCSRSLVSYPLLPAMKVDEFGKVMNEVKSATSKLSDKGAFYPLDTIDDATKQDLVNSQQWFETENKRLKSIGVTEFAKGRGIYRNTTKDLVVWVNEEDHLKIISMDKGGDIKTTFNRLKQAISELEKILQFNKNDRLGYLTFCPTNLGTTINATMTIKLPKLTGGGKTVQDVVTNGNLNVCVEQSATDTLYEISNKRKLGVSEFDAVKDLYDGVKELLKEENAIQIPVEEVASYDEAKHRVNALKNTCTSLLIQHLTTKMINDNENIATINQKTLLDCIKPGLRDPNLTVGLYAADVDAYDKFPDVFGPVVREYHGVAENVDHPPDDDWTVDDSSIKTFDPKYIKSTRISCSRSLQYKALYPAMTDADYTEVMNEVKPVLEKFDADLKGQFFDLELIRQNDQQLVKGAAGNVTGRAIFVNTQKTFIVWVNEEDHLKFISTANEYDVETPFERLKRAVTVEFPKHGVKFAKSSKWGWITSCPTNVGSAIDASVVADFPTLKARGNIEDLIKRYNLNICVKELPDSSHYEITNKQKLGLLAWGAVLAMQSGVEKLIEEEEKP